MHRLVCAHSGILQVVQPDAKAVAPKTEQGTAPAEQDNTESKQANAALHAEQISSNVNRQAKKKKQGMPLFIVSQYLHL